MTVRFREGRREDVAAIVALLADDPLGAARERASDPPSPAYLDAFDRIAADPRNLLAVGEDDAGRVVATLQLTFIPGLSNQGAELALIEAVRVDSSIRGEGVGGQFVQWAMDQARTRGCRFIELFTHQTRKDAQRFYARLGFEASHVGMRRAL